VQLAAWPPRPGQHKAPVRVCPCGCGVVRDTVVCAAAHSNAKSVLRELSTATMGSGAFGAAAGTGVPQSIEMAA
jgi:hypothetical protein